MKQPAILMPETKFYVLGFAFDDLYMMPLIQKQRPLWQKDLWNGVGGRVMSHESAAYAMAREFHEETGVYLPADMWKNIGRMYGSEWHVEVFTLKHRDVSLARTTTDERVQHFRDMPQAGTMIPNLPALIALATMHHIGVEVPEFTFKYEK